MILVDDRFMQAALAFGRRGLGHTATNPSVGALVVKDGILIGRGFTQSGGRPHAEPVALAQAGADARGATLYVTLEPCSHHGKTPPCVEAIIAAGITKVVSALADPDPRVSGRGHAQLRSAGLEVIEGLGAEAARRDHIGHICRVTRHRPMLTLKLARTADGFAGATPGAPRLMISGPASQNVTHMQRAMHDAVMIGIGTVLADDPQLSVRLPGMAARQPMRIVLDAGAKLPEAARLADGTAPVLLICGEAAPEARLAFWRARGLEVVRVGLAQGRLDLAAVADVLFSHGLSRVFCEGGPRLARRLLAAGLVDQLRLITNQELVAGAGIKVLDEDGEGLLAGDFRRYDHMRLGPDCVDDFEKRED